MAQIQPTQFVNIIALGIAILPFFATNALFRIERLGNEGWEGYLKVGINSALFLATFITILVVSNMFNVAGVVIGDVRISGVYLLFLTMYLPTFGLLIPPLVEATGVLFDSDLNRWILAGLLIVVGIAATQLIPAYPVV